MDAALNRHQLIATNTTLLPHAHTLSHQEIEDFRSSPCEVSKKNMQTQVVLEEGVNEQAQQVLDKSQKMKAKLLSHAPWSKFKRQ